MDEAQCSNFHGLDRPNDACCILAKSVWQCEDLLSGSVVSTCDDCMGPPPPPPPICVPTSQAQGGVGLTPTSGDERPPNYCLRLDGFKDNGVVTFSCEEVFWAYDGADELVVWGSVFGGRDTGSAWSNPQQWFIWARYTGIAPGQLSSATTAEVLVIYDDDESYTYSGQLRMGTSLDLSLNFRVGSEPRASTLYTAEGWLVSNDGFDEQGAQDWIVLLQCEPDTPPPPSDPRRNWCCECEGSKKPAMAQCLQALPFDPSWRACGTLGELVCREVGECSECLCRTSADCATGECCSMGTCEPTANACLKCPGEPGFTQCTEVGCSVAIDCVTVNGVNVLEALEALEQKE